MVRTKNLAALSDLTKQLNSLTDSLNKSIEALNQQLAALNIGIEYFLDAPLRSSGMHRNSSYSPPMRYEVNTYLGYCKIAERWQLAIRKDTIEYQWDASQKEEHAVKECDYTALLEASRDLRLLAVNGFDQLIDGLTESVKSKLELIEQAAELAKPK